MIAYFVMIHPAPNDVQCSPIDIDKSSITVPPDDSAVISDEIYCDSTSDLLDLVGSLLKRHAAQLTSDSQLLIRVSDNQLTAWVMRA